MKGSPQQLTADGAKLDAFERSTSDRLILAVGAIPDMRHPEYPESPAGPGYGLSWSGDYGAPYAWSLCLWCGRTDITWEGRDDRVCGRGAHQWNRDRYAMASRHAVARLLDAYDAARSARFEPGEAGVARG
ncbi:hypothetical protein [Micromonospora sp. DPT]|uniref:hypothetical protein n=1 Tax=Micromonospora sp. DPT TaxID=3142975 RepID=UPI0032084DAD